MWAAKLGLDALAVTWDPGPGAAVNSDQIWRDLRATDAQPGVVGNAYSDSEIAAVANYVTARFGTTPSRIDAAQVAALRKAASQ
jgi:hypothetical protein